MSLREKKFRPQGMPAKKLRNNEENNNQQDNVNQQNLRDSPQKKNKKQGGMEGMQQPQEENMEFQGKTNISSLAQDILREGFIQSYIDFFTITRHGGPQNIYGGNQRMNDMHPQYEFSENQLLDLKNQLMIAEDSSRYHNPVKTPAIEGYYRLAEQFFDEYQDFHNAAYFYKRVIHISKAQEEDKWEGKGQLGCGKCYDKMDKTTQAIEILEKSLLVAERKEIDSLVEQISTELIRIYNKRAQNFEKAEFDGIQEALIYYEKCLEVAKKLKESDQIGNICHKIGLLYYKDGQYEKAKDYQQEFLNHSKEDAVDKTSKQMNASASLAKCYIKLNQTDEALNHLQVYYSLAQNQHNAKSDAALHLATLWAQKGDTEKSNQFYKEHFKEAKEEKPEHKDRKLVDRARVTVGIALANANIDKHIQLVKNSDTNLKALLDWKCKKSDAK